MHWLLPRFTVTQYFIVLWRGRGKTRVNFKRTFCVVNAGAYRSDEI